MKRIKEYLIIGTVVCFSFFSCYEDSGNYNYIDYNKIEKIEGKGTLSVILGDTIRIVPKMKWKHPDKDTTAFEYKWELDDSIISVQRELEYVPDKIMSKQCNLYVTEKASGMVTVLTTGIEVLSPFDKGWTILSEDSGASILSYIRRDEKEDEKEQKYYEYVAYKDIYKNFFSGSSLGNNPKKLSYLQTGWNKDEVLVIQHPDESVYLSGLDFSKSVYLKEEFIEKEYPKEFVPKAFIDGVKCCYLLGENGQVFWKTIPQSIHLTNFISFPLFQSGGLKVDFFSDVRVYGVNIVHMYDVLHNRLLARNTSGRDRTSGAKIELINSTKPEDVADINNLGNYKLLHMGGDHPNYMLILKDTTSGEYMHHTYRIESFSSFTNTAQLTNHHQEIFAGSTFISDSTKFLDLRRMSYLFFGEGSKLYFYDKNTQKVKLYHDFGSGNIVKIVAEAKETEIGVALDSGDMYVCSTSVEVLANENPGKEGGILHHTTGLGKIIDVIWKYGGSYPIYI